MRYHSTGLGGFANNGAQYQTSAILKVEDQNGKTLEEWVPSEGTQVMNADIANRVSDVLSDNNSRAYVFGGRNFLTLPGRAVAAKIIPKRGRSSARIDDLR